MQFDTKCAVLVVISAVLTAHLSGRASSAPPDLLVGFWGVGEGEKGREREVKESGKGKERKRKGRIEEGDNGKESEEGRGREEFCAVVIFLSGNPGSSLFINCIV